MNRRRFLKLMGASPMGYLLSKYGLPPGAEEVFKASPAAAESLGEMIYIITPGADALGNYSALLQQPATGRGLILEWIKDPLLPEGWKKLAIEVPMYGGSEPAREVPFPKALPRLDPADAPPGGLPED